MERLVIIQETVRICLCAHECVCVCVCVYACLFSNREMDRFISLTASLFGFPGVEVHTSASFLCRGDMEKPRRAVLRGLPSWSCSGTGGVHCRLQGKGPPRSQTLPPLQSWPGSPQAASYSDHDVIG